ncbi:MAG TPA: hypothetical protein VFP13_10250 [Actinomycetota bacterium]|nr:hypothetical protein [Actinomycetota bacterium]
MLRTGSAGLRKLIGSLAVALVAVACGEAAATSPPGPGAALLIRQSPSPFQHVSAGPVTAFIPDEWRPKLAGPLDDPRQGIVAGPRPQAWRGERPPLEGLAAMWIDGTAVGVPSDYYYLAATGPALDLLTGSEQCRATRKYIVADHLPAFADGAPDSPGDYVAHGLGTCTVGDRPTRWAYFVAAPGYGPVREVGIPTSGLYLVVAVMPASPRASFLLNRLLRRTEFNGSSVADMLEAAAPVPAPDDATV